MAVPSSANVNVDADDSSRYLLECPICLEDLKRPIYQCPQGHILCATCRPKFVNCPTCKEAFPTGLIRNRALEDILESDRDISNGIARPTIEDIPVTLPKREHTPPPSIGRNESRTQIHELVYCDGPDCRDRGNARIEGIRYKCLECENYDLCEECERKGVHDQHLFLRMAMPTDKKHIKTILKKRREL